MPNTAKQGVFIPTYVTYGSKTAEAQAREILTKARKLHTEEGYNQIGITYSANHDQTNEIRKAYAKGDWLTKTGGGGQAATIAAVERLLGTEFKDLQGIFRILPITTCAHSGGVGAVAQQWLNEDLGAIKNFASQPNHAVLGWQNEDSGRNSYAVGGGGPASAKTISQQLNALVPGETNKTQHQYVLENLKKIEQQYSVSQAKNVDSTSSKEIMKKMEETSHSHHYSSQPVTHSTPKSTNKPSTTSSEQRVKQQSVKPLTPSSEYQSDNSAVAVAKASKQLVQEIKQKEPHIGDNADFIIRKGNINGTFKVGFTTSEEAKNFFDHLKEIGFEKVTYFGNKESYPMNGNGDVTTSGTYKHIVRFEVPEDALKYLENIKVSNSENLYNSIMSAEPPANTYSMHR